MNNINRWLPHPIVLFLFSVASLAATLFLCIFWYIEVKSGLEELIGRLNFDPFMIFQSRTWVVIVILFLIVGFILAGIFMTFVYYQKVLQLYSHQQNFINNFTHELKTPVTSLKLYLETFLKHDLGRDEQHKYLNYMLLDVSRLSDNINGILDLARLESDEYEGDFVRQDIVAVTRQFLSANAHLFKDAEIIVNDFLTHRAMPGLDTRLYEMLLMNILTNALKYNNAENCRVTITFTKSGKSVLVSFRDNGIGIGKKEEAAIFRKFYQSEHSGRLASGGSGLGLYLVHIIARLHGGRIAAKSWGLGNGCEFILMLADRAQVPKKQVTETDKTDIQTGNGSRL